MLAFGLIPPAAHLGEVPIKEKPTFEDILREIIEEEVANALERQS
jgi:hypothetical protein